MEAWPPAQSKQFVPSNAAIVSANRRQAPGFLNSHHPGTIGEAVARCTTASSWLTWDMPAPRTKLPRSELEPASVSQAKLRLLAPPSPKQSFQRRFTPGAANAGIAGTATSRTHARISRVSMFPPGLQSVVAGASCSRQPVRPAGGRSEEHTSELQSL